VEPKRAKAAVNAGVNSEKKKQKPVPLQQVASDEMRTARSIEHVDVMPSI
jgi:hypothetical protein